MQRRRTRRLRTRRVRRQLARADGIGGRPMVMWVHRWRPRKSTSRPSRGSATGRKQPIERENDATARPCRAIARPWDCGGLRGTGENKAECQMDHQQPPPVCRSVGAHVDWVVWRQCHEPREREMTLTTGCLVRFQPPIERGRCLSFHHCTLHELGPRPLPGLVCDPLKIAKFASAISIARIR